MKRIAAQDASKFTTEVCRTAPVISVLTIENQSVARNLGEALVAGGLPVLEVTLRTNCALDAISKIADIKGGIVGAGTLLTPLDVKNAKAAGAKFGVSPGATDALIDACETEGLPLLPGASTASEAMRLLECGYTMQKFFPAEASGGVNALRAFSAPFPEITFCPTGGITQKNATSYLQLPNVLCVGGSWIATNSAIKAGDWEGIKKLAISASQILN